jgi:hypothetical protein
VSGRRDRHATELQAGRVGTGCLPGRSDRHAAQLPTRGTHDHGEVPRWPSRHAAELHGSAAGEVSGRSNRDATELQAGHRRAVPCGPDRHAAELQGAAAREMSCGPDRHAAELQVAAAGEMSCGPDRHTAELPPRSGTAMSHRPDRHAAELPACCGGADAACRGAPDTACRLPARQATQCSRAMRVSQLQTGSPPRRKRMRTMLRKAALATAIASTIGVTGAIGAPVKNQQPDPRRPPQAAGPNQYVVCLSRASGQRLLPGSEARKRFMNRCMK